MRNLIVLIVGTSLLYLLEYIYRVPSGVYSYALLKPLIIFDLICVGVITFVAGILGRRSLYKQVLKCKRKRQLLKILRPALKNKKIIGQKP